MPENKKHHYVPRFYLKRFSYNKKSISLYNLTSKRKIKNANLKNQCYKNYYYGKNQVIEHSLATIETKAAQIFINIDKTNELPLRYSSEHLVLIIFILAQYGRTKYSIDALDEMMDKLIKNIYGSVNKNEGIDLDKVKIKVNNTAQRSVYIMIQSYPLLLDLEYKLLKNCTNEEFVSSDNPVILYNQLLKFRNFGSDTGLSTKGLQIFFPIDPNNVLILYDHNVYRVGNDTKKIINITNIKDIYEINTLQICSCLENIYFLNESFDCDALYKKGKPFLLKSKSLVKTLPEKESKYKKSLIIMSSRNDIITNLSLSFLTIRKSAKLWCRQFQKRRLQPTVIIRNEMLHQDNEDFIEAVKEKKYTQSQFFKFVREKYK